jgi:hypothetical protein
MADWVRCRLCGHDCSLYKPWYEKTPLCNSCAQDVATLVWRDPKLRRLVRDRILRAEEKDR